MREAKFHLGLIECPCGFGFCYFIVLVIIFSRDEATLYEGVSVGPSVRNLFFSKKMEQYTRGHSTSPKWNFASRMHVAFLLIYFKIKVGAE